MKHDESELPCQEGAIWKSLSKEQQQKVLIAYEESEDESNLVSLSSIKSKFKE